MVSAMKSVRMIIVPFLACTISCVLVACGSNTTSPIAAGDSSTDGVSSSPKRSSFSPTSSISLSSALGLSSSAASSLDTTWGSIDYQGWTYKTIQIDDQTWFAENLNSGILIQGSTYSAHQNDDGLVEKFCYNDSESSCDIYGGLYQWAEAMALPSACNQLDCSAQIAAVHQGICPDGWHVPSRDEWKWLAQIPGDPVELSGGLGGRRIETGTFDHAAERAYFWEAEDFSSNLGYYRFLSSATAVLDSYRDDKANGFSVRCVKNPSP